MIVDLQKLRSNFFAIGGAMPVPLAHKMRGFIIRLRFFSNIVRRKPRLGLRLLARVITSKLLRLSDTTFRTVTLAVDYKCNFACQHCNISQMLRSDVPRLSLDDYQRINHDFEQHGILGYTLTGGEPLIFDKLFDLIKTLRPENKLILIQTNGAVLDFALAKRLYENGVDGVAVSIDSMHASQKGDSDQIDFSWYDGLLEIANRAGLQIQLLYVVDDKNIQNGEFNRVINYCFQRRVMLLFNMPIPLGGWQNCQSSLISPANSKFIRTLEKNTPYAKTDHQCNIKACGCPAFKEKIYVTPYGDVLGCTFLQFSVGSLRNERISNVLQRAKKLEYFSEYLSVCPPAEDYSFVEKYLAQLNRNDNLPMTFETGARIFEGLTQNTNPSCPLCESTRTTLLYRRPCDYDGEVDHHYDYYKCLDCQATFLNPMPHGGDEIAKLYPSDYYTLDETSCKRPINSFLWRLYIKLESSKIKNLCRGKRKILDIGCGDGQFLERLHKFRSDLELYGVDIDLPEATKSKVGIRFIPGDLLDVVLAENSFDAINMGNFIEHINNPSAIMSRAYQLLNEHGVLVGETPNTASLGHRFWKRFWGPLHTPRHLIIYNKKNFTDLLRETGFKKIVISGSWRPSGWAKSLKNALVARGCMKASDHRSAIYPLFIVLSLPFVLIENLLSLSSTMTFTAYKQDDY